MTPIPGFDQDHYVPESNATNRSKASLMAEYHAVREANLHLFSSLTEQQYAHKGTASDNPVTPLALGYIIAGHEVHHIAVLKDRYL